ncbi:helix-turn-helix domain-containing protein [Marinomonas sp. 2405UD68-3]|uniref:helix-turn-helix domain-containing protein n=1 Tax=Marinomonas sp. 2405UD68-3 TaxID=3391835 RepID=UPI0039C9EC32
MTKTRKFDSIFDTVTDSKEESSELQTRADLMIAIRDIVNQKGWKQAEAAEKLSLSQPRVSDLLNGKIDLFSIDLLMTCLFRLGFRFKPLYQDEQLTIAVQTT